MQTPTYPNAVTVTGHKAGHGACVKAATCSKTLGAGLTTGKGLGITLGLGLGAGIWGPVAVVGFGVACGYYYWKKAHEMLD